MNRILAISMFLLTMISGAYAAPDQEVQYGSLSSIDERFIFESSVFDSTTAFIHLDGDNANESSIDASDLIEFAKQYIGRPYRRGAKGPKAFDCSGFTSFVYRNFDISLSPSSGTQSTQGEEIQRADIMPGDLLFFKGRGNNSRVGHVGIAVDVEDSGNVKFIHAATSGGIRIDNLNDAGYYQKRYVGARRVIK